LDSFLDSKIAEEQARQKGQPGTSSPIKRTPSNAARRGVSRTESPNRPANRARADSNRGIPIKGPDPSDFVIDDDEPPTRTATPTLVVTEASASSSDPPATSTDDKEPSQSEPLLQKSLKMEGNNPKTCLRTFVKSCADSTSWNLATPNSSAPTASLMQGSLQLSPSRPLFAKTPL